MSYTLVVIEYKGNDKHVLVHDIFEEYKDGIVKARAFTSVYESQNRPRMGGVDGPISHCGMYSDMYIDAAVLLNESESRLIKQALKD